MIALWDVGTQSDTYGTAIALRRVRSVLNSVQIVLRIEGLALRIVSRIGVSVPCSVPSREVLRVLRGLLRVYYGVRSGKI